MTGGRVKVSRGAISSNSMSSGVKTRAAKPSGVGAVSDANCGMCMASFGDVSLGCGGCNSMYHPTRVCLGLLDSVIDVIKEYGARGANFSCTTCRLEEGSVSNGSQSGSVFDGSRGLFGWWC